MERSLIERIAALGESTVQVLLIMIEQSDQVNGWEDSKENNQDIQIRLNYTYSGLQRHKVKLKNLGFLLSPSTKTRKKYIIDTKAVSVALW